MHICVNVHHDLYRCPQKPEEDVGSPRALVKAAVSFLTWVLGTQIGSFWKSSKCS